MVQIGDIKIEYYSTLIDMIIDELKRREPYFKDYADDFFHVEFNFKKNLSILKFEHRESEDLLYAELRSETAWILCDEMKINLDDQYLEATIGLHAIDYNYHDCQNIELGLICSGKEFYNRYIRSEAWRSTRNEIFKQRGFKCELCGKRKNLQIHHITYQNLGRENLNDLIILCGVCHKDAHSS